MTRPKPPITLLARLVSNPSVEEMYHQDLATLEEMLAAVDCGFPLASYRPARQAGATHEEVMDVAGRFPYGPGRHGAGYAAARVVAQHLEAVDVIEAGVPVTDYVRMRRCGCVHAALLDAWRRGREAFGGVRPEPAEQPAPPGPRSPEQAPAQSPVPPAQPPAQSRPEASRGRRCPPPPRQRRGSSSPAGQGRLVQVAAAGDPASRPALR